MVLDEQKSIINQLSKTTVGQSHDRLPMMPTDCDSSGFPHSDDLSIITIDDEIKRIKRDNNNLEDINLTNSSIEQFSDINLANNIQDETLVKTKNCKHQMRFMIALLGLTIAVVNCYAQATFCISIVEMVLPSDYVFKGESGVNSIVKVVVAGSTGVVVPAQQQQQQQTANPDDQETIDHSCPVEYRYRDYYDSWRFPTPESSKNLSSQQQQQQANGKASTSNSFIDTSNRFDWDASRQGLLLGSFAIGTAPLQILGGRLAEIYGAKWVLMAGCIGTALTNLTIPILAHFSFTMLILNRITMGIAQAGMEPGLMCLLAEWLTPNETSFFISMLLFAICIGFFLGSLCSSFLLTLGYGWPITYYVAGGMNLVVAIVWFLYANSRPGESKFISAEELKYIESEQQFVRSMEAEKNNKIINNDLNVTMTNQSNLMHQDISSTTTTTATATTITIGNPSETLSSHSDSSRKINNPQINITSPTLNISNDNPNKDKVAPKVQAPWNNILRTPSVWAFIVCKISIRWCADVLAIELPTYLANVLHLSIKLNGILNSVSSALFAICSFITGYLVNEILKDDHRSVNDSLDGLKGGAKNCKQTKSIVAGKRKQISKTNLRKLMQSIASFGSAICVFLMTQYDCNIMFSMSMLLILSCCLVMGTGGELQIPYDMTSRYPGTLHGIACTLSVSGWLAPPLIGLILGDQPSSRYRWSLVWYLTALINLIGGLVFVLFADASPRDFDHQGSEKRQRNGGNSSIAKAKAKAKNESFPRRKINKQSNNLEYLKQFQVGVGVGDKTISVGQEVVESDRGRHMMSYYNIACKSSDVSPVQKRSSQREQNHGLSLEENRQQHLSWSSYFDRDLIKIRQIEDSFIEPGYLNNFDSIARTQTMIFPYQTKPKPKSERFGGDSWKSRGGIVKFENDNEYATNLVKLDKQQQQIILSESSLIWRLWSRVPNIIGGKRRKFSFGFEREDSSKAVGQIRANREGKLEFVRRINPVILPDVLPHSRKQSIREKSTTTTTGAGAGAAERATIATREEAGIDSALRRRGGGAEDGSIMRGEKGNNARELHLERDGNQQLVESTAASSIPNTTASTLVSTIMAPLPSKTITHL